MTGQKLYPGAELRGIFRLKGFIRDIDEEVDVVVVGGGGAEFLKPEEGICILDNPQMGNARGYYIYGEKVLSSY